MCIPRISALYHNGEYNALIELSRLFARLNSCCALLIGLPLLIAPGFVVSLLGDSFNTPTTTYALFWLTVSRLITIPLGPVAPLLAMTNNEL